MHKHMLYDREHIKLFPCEALPVKNIVKAIISHNRQVSNKKTNIK